MSQPATSDPIVRVRPPGAGAPRILDDLPIAEIHPDPDNPRSEVGDVSDLVATMREHGLLQPITVRRDPAGGYRIVMGERRWTAARQMGWTTIRAIVRDEFTGDAVLEAMFFENHSRRDLDPIDEALALRSIFHSRKFGSVEQLAIHVGRSLPFVSGRLALLDLSPEDQVRVRTGELNVGEAYWRVREARGEPRRPRAAKPETKARSRSTTPPPESHGTGRSRSDAAPAPATPAEPPPAPDAVRAAIARALRAESEYFRRAAGRGDPSTRRAYGFAADRLEDQAHAYEAGEVPLP